jgi:hypothetical protein
MLERNYFVGLLRSVIQKPATGDQQFTTIIMCYYSVLLPAVIRQQATREQHDSGNNVIILKWCAVVRCSRRVT